MELHERVREFTKQTVAAMGVPLDVTVVDAGDNIRVELSGDGGEVLLRRRAEALDALQQIVNTAFRRELKDDRSFVVDCMDYRKAQGCRAPADGALHDGKGQDRRAAGDGSLESVRATPGAPHGCRGSADVVREHRGCFPEDGDYFGRGNGVRRTEFTRGSNECRLLDCDSLLQGRRPSISSVIRRFGNSARSHMFSPDDTIVAIATPPGRGGIGVVRISGPSARQVAATISIRTGPLEPRRATLAELRVDGAPIDRAILTFFPAPHSYTGEDVVEISAHGSPVVLRSIVECSMHAGARLAEPGEFTFRAYLNGRIDLVQAEAVQDLVEAVTPLQARAAFDQLEGTLTSADSRD